MHLVMPNITLTGFKPISYANIQKPPDLHEDGRENKSYNYDDYNYALTGFV